MKRVAKCVLIGLVTVLVLLLAAVPFALPPLVRGLAEARLAALGFPSHVRLSLGYVWNKGPELSGSLQLNLANSPVEASATFGIGLGNWHAHLHVPETEFTETDPTVCKLLADHPLPGDVSNLTFRATLSLEASVERTRRMPVPVWSAKMPLRDVSLSLVRDDRPVAFDALSVTPGISGIADHFDISPMFLKVASVDVNGFVLTNLTAAIRAMESHLLVTESRSELCGGHASLYSLVLDPKTLNAGFTLFLDDVEAGEILSYFKGFRGEASGRLHGKMRLFLKEGGKSIRLSNAFLYSTPGETGKLKMTDAEVITGNLALAGVDADSQRNVANALNDLDYSVLKLDLKRIEGDAATLGVRLVGTATRGSLTVPVNLNLNFNGNIEQIVNTGLGLSNRLKGNKK